MQRGLGKTGGEWGRALALLRRNLVKACAFVGGLVMALGSCGESTIELFPGPPLAADASNPSDDSSAAAQEAGAVTRADTGPLLGACQTDSDCNAPGFHRCEPVLLVCVQCLADTDCANRTDSKCNRVTNKCALPCTQASDCLAPHACDLAQGACADCLIDLQCGRSEPHCIQEECVCVADSDCGAGRHCWDGRCVDCVTNADCLAPMACSADHVCQ